jgi:predicted ATP-dependent endonuclease of OLD family
VQVASAAVKLIKLQIENFRSLRNLEVDLEEYLSIVVGKNNAGKTSLLIALERFLSSSNASFDFDDFNLDFRQHILALAENKIQPDDPYPFCGIRLRVFIEYSDDDDLGNVGNKVIMDLDPDNKLIVLDFLYHLTSEYLEILRRDFKAHQEKKKDKAQDVLKFLRENHREYFKVARRSVQFDHAARKVQEDIFVDLIKESIRIDDIISFKRIAARRSVSNKENDKTLSTMSSKIYSAMSSDAGDEKVFDTFKEALSETDVQLDVIYDKLFKEVIDDVRRFGGVKEGDTQLQIRSTLQHRELLEDNTTVMYGQGAELHVLPESYNGLGYLNLISMIFDIKIILNEFKRGNKPKPADINLLFIEEPEAHTHPQMQAIFVKNIKSLVGRSVSNADGIKRPLQTILSTHSAHIVAESEFDDIKYFKKSAGTTVAKGLRDLHAMYTASGKDGHYTFLRQYLTLHRSQLFFADKAILVEGDTERILLPAMMRKIDQIDEAAAFAASEIAPLPLMSQNISVIEVGAHSQIFEIFLDFIGVKTLIITDLDSAVERQRMKDGSLVINKKGQPVVDIVAHPVEGGTHTTNAALRFFFGVGSALAYFLALGLEQKTVKKKPDALWATDPAGGLMCAYQVTETNAESETYCARSFEDAFFHVNRAFMASASAVADDDDRPKFPSLKQGALTEFIGGGKPDAMADNGIDKKPSFAIEILLNSETTKLTKTNKGGQTREFALEFSNWNIPKYIHEGLKWIKVG